VSEVKSGVGERERGDLGSNRKGSTVELFGLSFCESLYRRYVNDTL